MKRLMKALEEVKKEYPEFNLKLDSDIVFDETLYVIKTLMDNEKCNKKLIEGLQSRIKSTEMMGDFFQNQLTGLCTWLNKNNHLLPPNTKIEFEVADQEKPTEINIYANVEGS